MFEGRLENCRVDKLIAQHKGFDNSIVVKSFMWIITRGRRRFGMIDDLRERNSYGT